MGRQAQVAAITGNNWRLVETQVQREACRVSFAFSAIPSISMPSEWLLYHDRVTEMAPVRMPSLYERIVD